MDIPRKIKAVLLERKMTIKELSLKLGYKDNYLYTKMKRNNFTEEDLKEIAEALNCEYECVFTLKDTGKKI